MNYTSNANFKSGSNIRWWMGEVSPLFTSGGSANREHWSGEQWPVFSKSENASSPRGRSPRSSPSRELPCRNLVGRCWYLHVTKEGNWGVTHRAHPWPHLTAGKCQSKDSNPALGLPPTLCCVSDLSGNDACLGEQWSSRHIPQWGTQ